MHNYELIQFQEAEHLAQTVAGRWLAALQTFASSRKPYLVALSGGRIARQLFAAAAAQGKTQRDLFHPVHFFWADERAVPPDDSESNFAVASQLLFQPLDINESQIHRIQGEASPEVAASEAERTLRAVANAEPKDEPILDLVFLGMGEDGHVASLFPGETEAARNSAAIYRPVRAPKPPPDRITLGYAPIARAREAWVLASGAGKAEALRASLKNGAQTPLGLLLGLRQQTRIFTDVRF